MPLTITVSDPLASDLRTEANSRKISVERFALDVLGQAVHKRDWSAANRQRLTLIRKQFADGLTPEEASELQELQRQADEHLDRLDSQLLDDVATMEHAAAEALHGRDH